MWLLLHLGALAGIAWFDFKSRLIPLVLYMAAFVLAGIHLYQNLWQWPMVVVNVGIGLLQIAMVALWLKVRNRRLDFFNDAFGWGDVLMMLLLAFYLMPLQYLFFIIVSCLLSTAFAIIIKRRTGEEGLTIPLAGIMAVLLMFYQGYLFIT
ncbi:prepilin peptidase [Carboxylicivirga sediminis]|uniref:Prepilin peptidase n=1 Tax=Carboxylicivirga sediminis TaxID=2006564 RepID=A0A941F496_9BACT|nr:prepilin peptidase [Carboxylicivirga sediminis]MBR8534950.1 prepilin peptidase [Carboxylicivirga sediminis]